VGKYRNHCAIIDLFVSYNYCSLSICDVTWVTISGRL
jgi:hypothetical protein